MEWLRRRYEGAAARWRVRRLLTRCGDSGARLLVDTVLPLYETPVHPAGLVADLARNAVGDRLAFLRDLPLWGALQDGRSAAMPPPPGHCGRCAPAEPLRVISSSRSGSSAEGLADLLAGQPSSSDYDAMFELSGEFRWMETPLAAPGEEPGCISAREAPQLWARPTDSPGFVTLHWARTTECEHEAVLPALPALEVRRLMSEFCRATSSADSVITTPGPAVNVCLPSQGHGGLDHVPCLRLPVWPGREAFLSRRRVTEFPSAAARQELCQFGVHLVPTGRDGSATELYEWRLSFSRAEVVAIHQLTDIQRNAVLSVKRIKTALKESGASPALKSYYIKTAALWLAQDRPAGSWTGVVDGVWTILDWLEQHVAAGSLPCFFWPDIDLLAGKGARELSDMASTIALMRGRARRLRLRLARLLLRRAVVAGLVYRPALPKWADWACCFVPPLASEEQLLEWRHHCHASAYAQQCYLLRAMLVAPADLVGAAPLSPLGGGLFTWDAAPLMNLLDDTDLHYLLGDPTAVAAWCRRQLRRPEAERPAGLTAELGTPRGRADLLLRPELLLRAISEAVPSMGDWWRGVEERGTRWSDPCPPLLPLQRIRDALETLLSCSDHLDWFLQRRLPHLDRETAAITARFWRLRLRRLLAGDRLQTEYSAALGGTDRWCLRRHVLTEDGAAAEVQPRLHEQEERAFDALTQRLVELERRQLRERHAVGRRYLHASLELGDRQLPGQGVLGLQPADRGPQDQQQPEDQGLQDQQPEHQQHDGQGLPGQQSEDRKVQDQQSEDQGREQTHWLQRFQFRRLGSGRRSGPQRRRSQGIERQLQQEMLELSQRHQQERELLLLQEPLE
ncbi:Protein mab-21-like 3 [Amphibalanus amphitrite]|uniref:Protein mab-21-like 3 n=1 Tax=Amphibalanus amphitrite TaxID=1232801 RepID=A0A6A4XGX5_AMPAM|nr:Protein mab-21-like 3 [Amphibalanus amphitrite]